MKEFLDLSKSEIELTENGEINGLFILTGNEKIQQNIKFTHKLPNLHTRINLKFIVLDNAELDLQAIVRIDRGAAQTNTYLKIDTLLLSESARAHVIPSMEIQEDDVKGGHGATIGMLDEDQLWYLVSRGISQKNAEKILIEAFAKEIMEKISDPQKLAKLQEKLSLLQ